MTDDVQILWSGSLQAGGVGDLGRVDYRVSVPQVYAHCWEFTWSNDRRSAEGAPKRGQRSNSCATGEGLASMAKSGQRAESIQ